ncbi:MAG: hypothetical protein AAF349_00270 [Cyanobacteria bacterium P01_A01_bin.68]
MALPLNFNHWEYLQDILRREQNKIVAQYFSDLGGSDWEPNLTTSRAKLRTACTIQDKDTAIQTQIRLYLFYEVLGYGKKRLGNFYGVPAREFQESVAGRPQVFLFFSQDRDSVPEGLDPVTAEVSFRLHDETSESITEAKAKTIASAIKREMISGNKGIYFSKGRNIYSYNDRSLGYKLQIYATSQTEAEKVIKPVLKIRGHVYEDDKLSVSIPKRASLNVPRKSKTIYGKQKKERRWRPTARVRFRSAYLYVHGLDYNVPLIDTTGHWFDSLVKV